MITTSLKKGSSPCFKPARLKPRRFSAMNMILETERLLLREWEPGDAEALLSMVSDAEVMRFIGDGRPWEGVERVREWIGRIEESYRARGYGRWAVAERGGGRVVGSCGFQLQPWSGLTDFGYMFARGAWGRGYATEIGRAALAHGFERYGFAEVTASVAPGNEASRRVLEKLGFVYARTELLPGEDEESLIYVAKNPGGESPNRAGV